MRAIAFMAVLYGFIANASPYVTNVVAKQRFPWNGLVDVKYEIVGSTNGINYAYGALKATDRDTGKVYSASSFVKPLDLNEETHHAIWDMSADVEVASTNVVFSVSIEKPALYLVVDLSGGADAASYPVSELNEAPENGWSEQYKTTKLVLRFIEPGTFKMNGSYDVTLTKPYYIGVFEVTQKQYQLVTGNSASRFSGDKLPVERVLWNTIRGDSSTYNWPTVRTVDSNSFVGRLRERTGLELDLPTEAQWEYACRAGTTTAYSYGDSVDDSYMWYDGNSSSTTHEVGTKLPNAWGLFDMHGNVSEWCLDWHSERLSSGTDPEGSSSGSHRVLRGGSWSYGAGDCASSNRHGCYPSLYYATRDGFDGFRLVGTLSK